MGSFRLLTLFFLSFQFQVVLKCLDDEIVIDFIFEGGQMREVQASRKNIPIGGRGIRGQE